MSQNRQEKPAEEAAETSAAPKAKGKAKAASARDGFNQENIGFIWVTLGESSRNGWTCEVNNYELFRFMGLSRLYHANKEFKPTIYGEIIWIYWRSITLWNQQSDVLVCRNGIWSSLFSDTTVTIGGETPNHVGCSWFKHGLREQKCRISICSMAVWGLEPNFRQSLIVKMDLMAWWKGANLLDLGWLHVLQSMLDLSRIWLWTDSDLSERDDRIRLLLVQSVFVKRDHEYHWSSRFVGLRRFEMT